MFGVANWIHALLVLTGRVEAPARVAAHPAPQGPDDTRLCDTCVDPRTVFVDYEALGLPGRNGGEWVTYDYDELTRPLAPGELSTESELSVAVRLELSEVGADRILVNRLGLYEGLGILYTVDNRLDASTSNPEGRDAAPSFPGCAPGQTFQTCADPKEYLGLQTWRALDPGRSYDPELLERATDVAVAAAWLRTQGIGRDAIEGATSYVHRCGGDAAYGAPTWKCDAHLGRPRGDIAGANPHTGPIVFKGPDQFLERRGYYSMREAAWVDYVAIDQG